MNEPNQTPDAPTQTAPLAVATCWPELIMNADTPKTNAKAERILAEFGPNNGQRFAAMTDYARDQERQLSAIARLTKTLSDSPKSLQAHLERWADDFLANTNLEPRRE